MKFVPQHDLMDCGPACILMISLHYGKVYDLEYLREQSYISREGVSLLNIVETSKKIGFETFSTRLSLEQLIQNKEAFPVILHWNQNHFIVLRKISKKKFSNELLFHIADPAYGFININQEKFENCWKSNDNTGIALFLQPTETFYKKEPVKLSKISNKYLFSYLKPYKKQLVSLFFLLLFGSLLTLIFPFLMQVLIDKGVNKKDLNFIFIILLSQLGLFIGSITVNLLRNWFLLFVGTHLSITIISDFLKKMLKLPIKFFDTKLMGDFQQRIQDNDRIEEFLTSQSLTTFFSIVTFLVFFGVLWYYDFKILIVYLLLTVTSIIWSFFWLRKRKKLDYYRFQLKSENQESIYEILNGITEMKLNQFESYKIKGWERIQYNLFKLNTRILKLDQIQMSGFEFFNQFKNIVVTFLAATSVVQGNMTLGMLLSISYIIGQMNSPISQLVEFFRSLQYAKLSLERLNEVQSHSPEENEQQRILKIKEKGKGIQLERLFFQYEGPKSPYILEDLNLTIFEGKVTAIVGASGSGKTTLMKLLLKFYKPSKGKIFYNNDDISVLSPKSIRKNCGVVMQDGYIFSDSIERNIVTGDEKINKDRLEHAVKVANIQSFIDSLPLGYNTKIGATGNGISGGQKQRILIARAVYKNPHYIFFDEATSALDAENEKIIHDNLQSFFKGKTVLIIAHRLSTVKNADQIIVLKNGKIVEKGTHQELVSVKNEYFNLVKNQLELGS